MTVQGAAGGGWHTVAPVPVSAGGAYRTTLPAGRYRIADGAVDGPAVTIP